MFGSIGLPEILLILVLALLIFGPKRLPEVGRTIGKGLSEFRRASADLKRTVNAELALDEDEHTRTPRRPETGRALAGEAVAAAAARRSAEAVPEVKPAQATTPRSAPGAAAAEPETAAPAPDAAPAEPPVQPPPEPEDAEAETEPAATTH